MASEGEKEYTKEAVLGRLSAKRVAKERGAFIPAFAMDTLVLLIALVSLWSAFSAETGDEAIAGFAGAVIGAPALFAISRFIRSRPTPTGWAWLAVSAVSLAWVLATEVFL